MRDPYVVIYNPEATEDEFRDAVMIIASPLLTWPMPYQNYVQTFFQQDTAMRAWLNISVPLLEAPNPWHIPADIRAQADVYARFVAYTDLMRALHDPE